MFEIEDHILIFFKWVLQLNQCVWVMPDKIIQFMVNLMNNIAIFRLFLSKTDVTVLVILLTIFNVQPGSTWTFRAGRYGSFGLVKGEGFLMNSKCISLHFWDLLESLPGRAITRHYGYLRRHRNHEFQPL